MTDQTYTLAQAAGELGIREDNLIILLPNAGVDLAGRTPPTLTQSEIDRLSRLIEFFHALHREGPYDVIDC